MEKGEAPESKEPATVEGSFVAEHRNPAIQFRLERVPGTSQRGTAACRSNSERDCLAGNPGQWRQPAAPTVSITRLTPLMQH
jgi:hypothetical protein